MARVRAVIEAVALVKDLVTTPADALGPADMAQATSDLLRELPATVRVWDETELETGGFGGILGVGRGSARPPRLVRAEYAPDGTPLGQVLQPPQMARLLPTQMLCTRRPMCRPVL